ncbi:MAG: calcium/proton exchanger [Planctomycetes bacterium]|nr:calcium/proton exchanger [Planctomycetota bacterium]
MPTWLKPSLSWLLIFVPIAAGLEFGAPKEHTWIFLSACLAIIPLAGWMGKATEHLAERTGEGIGGLLNATFGNAAELIIALMALRQGKYDIVKASLTGSILGNILLVLGAALLAGGLRFKTQSFNPGGARIQATMLILAAIALLSEAVFHHSAGPDVHAIEVELSTWLSGVMLVTYALGLVFTLHTHKQFFVSGQAAESAGGHGHGGAEGHAIWPLGKALAVLLGATALVAWVSEFLVGSVEDAARSMGMSDFFVGVIVVAVIGNAAEHSTAILVALKNRMDLSLSIAVGSSIQVALFVAPVLVFASYFIGPAHLGPLDLVFTPIEVFAVGAAVIIVHQIAGDGQCNWLEGVQLLSVYIILALAFYFLPVGTHAAH